MTLTANEGQAPYEMREVYGPAVRNILDYTVYMSHLSQLMQAGDNDMIRHEAASAVIEVVSTYSDYEEILSDPNSPVVARDEALQFSLWYDERRQEMRDNPDKMKALHAEIDTVYDALKPETRMRISESRQHLTKWLASTDSYIPRQR